MIFIPFFCLKWAFSVNFPSLVFGMPCKYSLLRVPEKPYVLSIMYLFGNILAFQEAHFVSKVGETGKRLTKHRELQLLPRILLSKKQILFPQHLPKLGKQENV